MKEILLTSSVLILALLALRRLFRRRVSLCLRRPMRHRSPPPTNTTL